MRREKIFPSYSRADEYVMTTLGEVMKAAGKEYVSDRTQIYGGEVWREKLKSLIKQADQFHLLWSNNSAASEEVENEWRYALTLKRQPFIHGLYWEEDIPPFPAELSHIQFSFIDLDRIRQGDRRAASPALTRKTPAFVVVIFLTSLLTVMAATFFGVRRAVRETQTPIRAPSPEPDSSRSRVGNDKISTSLPLNPRRSPNSRVPASIISVSRPEKGVVVTVGQTITDSVVVANRSSKLLKIDTSRVTGTNASEFRIESNNCNDIIPAHNKCTIYFVFTPVASGSRRAYIHVTAAGNSMTIPITTSAEEIRLNASRQRLDFQTVELGRSKSLTVRVTANRANFGFRVFDPRNGTYPPWDDFETLVWINSSPATNYGRFSIPDFSLGLIRCLTPPPKPDESNLNTFFWHCEDLAIPISFSPGIVGPQQAFLHIETVRGEKTLVLRLSGQGVK